MIDNQLRILIVDDNENDLHLAKRILDNNTLIQIACVTANRISAAIGVLENNGIDLVLLDLNIPGESIALEGLIKLRERFPNIPISILTGHAEFTSALTAIEYGAQGIIYKDNILNNINSVILEICYGVGRFKLYKSRILELENKIDKIDKHNRKIDKKTLWALLIGVIGLLAGVVGLLKELFSK